MKITKILLCFLCMLSSVTMSAEDNSDAVMMDARPCLDIVSAIERLTCFEEQANAALHNGTSSSQNLPVVTIQNNTRQFQEQSPQLASREVHDLSASKGIQEQAQEMENVLNPMSKNTEINFDIAGQKVNGRTGKTQANELIARVAKLQELNRNRFRITLENGQVWEQMETRRFVLDEGEEIRIYPTRWGNSYRLSSLSHRGFIQVQRIR